MADQTSSDAYENGVSGSGQKWKDRVDTDRAESNFTGGVDSDAASDLTENAKDNKDDYQSNLAEAFGLSEVDSNVVSNWEDGLDSEAESNWESETSAAGETWRDGVGDVSASDWESDAKDASGDWFNNTKEGLKPD